MANTVDIQTIEDGERNVVVKVYLASDGASGELTDQVLVDFSTLSGLKTDLKLMKVEGQLTGFDATLEWDATADAPIIGLYASAGAFVHCFKEFGGIPNNAGAGKTGDLTITTSGFAAAGDAGFICLHCRKKG